MVKKGKKKENIEYGMGYIAGYKDGIEKTKKVFEKQFKAYKKKVRSKLAKIV